MGQYFVNVCGVDLSPKAPIRSVPGVNEMIVTQAAAPVYPQPKTSTLPTPAPETVTDAGVEPTAKGGARGLALLASGTAAIILTEQSIPQVDTPAAGPAPAGLDLRGQDLREVDLSTLDLRGADLSDANLSGKDMTGLDLRGATMTRANLDGANLTDTNLNAVSAAGASFRQASFARTKMNDADFSGAKFAGASFGAARTGADEGYYQIKSTRFDGADFSKSDLRAISYMKDSSFDGAVFNGADFGAVKHRTITFDGGSLRGASFQQVKGAVSIVSADASGADFTRIDGAKVGLFSALVDRLSFAGSSVTLSMSDVDARGMNLAVKDKNLRGADFTNVIMTGMDLRGYDLTGSSLVITSDGMRNSFLTNPSSMLKTAMYGTNLTGANLDNALIQNADLRNTAMDGASLNGTDGQVWDSKDVDIIASYRQLGILPPWWDDVPARSPQPGETPRDVASAAGQAAATKPVRFDMRQALVDAGILDAGKIDVLGDGDAALLKLFDTDAETDKDRDTVNSQSRDTPKSSMDYNPTETNGRMDVRS